MFVSSLSVSLNTILTLGVLKLLSINNIVVYMHENSRVNTLARMVIIRKYEHRIHEILYIIIFHNI